MAKPMPSALVRVAVLMPTTSPAALSSGPPELPGLIAASVCMKSRRLSGKPSSALDLLMLLMMPTVTVLSRPSGLPRAMAQSPTWTASESPRAANGKSVPWGGSTLTTARSSSSSEPITLPSNCRESVSVTRAFVTPLTTCALVMMMPDLSTMIPEPWPRSFTGGRSFAPLGSWFGKSSLYSSAPNGSETVRSVSIRTTAGPTFFTALTTKFSSMAGLSEDLARSLSSSRFSSGRSG
mmetsp:Transcript_18959/g.32631  ORF Transcript_18959/g.32631 Transcript_18959/m.32631 type:complete len:237 (+) Transcript_18959:3-713(+)